MTRGLFLGLLLFHTLGFAHSYALSVCAIFRNEAPYLKEWIEYHRIVGVEHFYLFNHMSDDSSEEVLAHYIDEGIVELFDWPIEIQSHRHWIVEIQGKAYTKIAHERKGESKWIAFIDTDEFIVPVQKDDLREVLQEYEQFPGLCVHWQCYGTSHVAKVPKNTPMIECLLYKAPRWHEQNALVKSIVRPEEVDRFEEVHFPFYFQNQCGVSEAKLQVPWLASRPIPISKIRINHYIYRDEDFYWNEKMERYRRKSLPTCPPNEELNSVYDPIMLRFVPELKRRLYEAA